MAMQEVIVALCAGVLILLIVVLALLLWQIADDRRHTETKPARERTAVTRMHGEQTASRAAVHGAFWIRLVDTEDGRRYQSSLDRSVIFGRTVPGGGFNDIGISPSVSVSKQQFQIFQADRHVYLRNLSQINETRLNGRALRGPVRLRHGDIIQAAEIRLRVYLPGG